MRFRGQWERRDRIGLALLAGLAGTAVVLVAEAVAGPAASAARPPQAAVVRLGEYFCRPARISVRVGQPVTFVNVGHIQHTVADTDARGRSRSRVIKPR